MKTKLFSVLLILLSSPLALLSQASFNIDLIGQKNEHRFGGIGPDTSFHYSSCWGYTHPNGREYAIIGYWNGTAIYEITNAPNVVQCDTFPGPTSFYNYREFTVVGNYLYAVSEGTNNNAGLQIVNLIYLPDSVQHVTNWTGQGYQRAHTVRSLGNYLYINGAYSFGQGVTVVDVTNPTAPVKRGGWNISYVHDCFIRNDTIFTANVFNTINCMTVINAINKDALIVVTQWTYPDPGTHLVWTTADRRWLVTSDEINAGRHARIWNSQNLNNITFVYEYIPYETATVHNSYFKGNLLFMAHYKAGVVVLDCTNLPAAPTVKGYYDTFVGTPNTGYHGAWNVFPYYASGKFVVSDMKTGLYVFKFSDASGIAPIGGEIPKDFKLHQNYPNPFNPSTTIEFDLAKSGNISLKIYDALGKEIETVFEGYQFAGKYSLNYNAKNSASGIYYYTLRTDNFSDVKKMVLAK